MPEDARATVLAAVRGAVDGVRDADPDAAYGAIGRGYRTGGAIDEVGRLELLTERLEEYGVSVRQVAAAELPTAVAAWARAQRARDCQLLLLEPRDKMRYGQKLWVDVLTGMRAPETMVFFGSSDCLASAA